MDIGAFGKGKGKQSEGKHGKGKVKGKQGQQGQGRQGRDKSKDRDKSKRIRWNVGTVASADISRKTVGVRMTTKVVRKENTRRTRRMLTIWTRRNQKKTMSQKLKLVDFICVPSMLMSDGSASV